MATPESDLLITPSDDSLAVLLLAPPGAGKGTQADLLAEHYRITHISSGALLRANVAQGTNIGAEAAGYLSRGDLVPDDLVIEILTVPVLRAIDEGGFVLDGFPRTLRQAKAERFVRLVDRVALRVVVHLAVGDEELRRRLLARADEQGRNDDTADTVAHRLDVFERETRPLVDYYGEHGELVSVNGEQPVDAVFRDMTEALDRLGASTLKSGQGQLSAGPPRRNA
jgi:adenylate kinase